MVTELTQETFNEMINSDEPVVVDFWASWCGPCRMVSPIIEQLSEEYEGRVKVCKVNVDNEGALAAHFAIASIPTVILFKNGKEIKKMIGAHSLDDYCDMVDEVL